MTTFIRVWLQAHQREGAPIYIVGESYGGFRLAEMAANIGDLNIAGLVLISPAINIEPEGDLAYVFDLPSMAAAAYAHGKIDTTGRTVDQVYEEARAFAQGDYSAALAQGWELPDNTRTQIAERMAHLIGLPASEIVADNLRVPSQDFLDHLVPGQVVGRVDTRVAAPAPNGALVPGRSRAADDPALGMGRSNVIKSPIARDYLVNEVGVRTDLDYAALTLDVNFAWNWNSGSPSLDRNMGFALAGNIATLMRQHTNVRLLLMSGYYDLAAPMLSQRYALTHADVPRERVQMLAFAGPHTLYESPEDRAAASRALHAFIAAAAR
jgi:carboxypeptidase C (cathepsin A)